MPARRAFAVLVLLSCLAACSVPAVAPAIENQPVDPPSVAATQVVEFDSEKLESGGLPAYSAPAVAQASALGAPESEQARASGAQPGAAAASDVATPSPLVFSAPGSGLVIKDAEIDLVVDDVARALSRVTQLASDFGGYLINSETAQSGGFATAFVRLAVPVQNFERALNSVRQLGLRVERERASGQDVTAEYTDLQSQLVNLEATAARVREFLKDARTVEESLRINQQLSELEGQIERVKGQLRYYEGRAAFSTMTVALRPETPTPTATPTPTSTPSPTPTATPTATPAWQPGKTFDSAASVLINVMQNVMDALIWAAVVGGPFVLLGGVVFGAGRLIQRRLK